MFPSGSSPALMALFDLLSLIFIRRTSSVVCIAHEISSRLDHVGLRLSLIFPFSSFLFVFVSLPSSSSSPSSSLFRIVYFKRTAVRFLHSHHWQYTGKDMRRRKRRETKREQCREQKKKKQTSIHCFSRLIILIISRHSFSCACDDFDCRKTQQSIERQTEAGEGERRYRYG